MHEFADFLWLLAIEVGTLVGCFLIVVFMAKKEYLSWKERWQDCAGFELLSMLAHFQQTEFFFRFTPIWGWYQHHLLLHLAIKLFLWSVFCLLAHTWPNQKDKAPQEKGRKSWSLDHIWSHPAPSPL